MYNYGIGIHLIESPAMEDYESRPINPKDNHISFQVRAAPVLVEPVMLFVVKYNKYVLVMIMQCTDVGLVKRRLQDMGMRYVTAVVEDDGVKVDQVFFHDPDGYMVELCNCENIPIIPISACAFKPRGSSFKKASINKCGFMETVMMESLSLDMMNFSF